ncbi:MAG: hypothetical protein IKO65_07425 [Victivallales bacterium]|nr:hypothetical protein [Victivallales bacterium]
MTSKKPTLKMFADLFKYFKLLYGFEAEGFRMETLRRRVGQVPPNGIAIVPDGRI